MLICSLVELEGTRVLDIELGRVKKWFERVGGGGGGGGERICIRWNTKQTEGWRTPRLPLPPRPGLQAERVDFRKL